MTTYLVTGATGFIGSHVCDRLLDEGGQVIGIDDLSGGSIENLDGALDRRGFDFVGCSLGSSLLGKVFDEYRPEVVVHLAAQSSVPQSLVDPVGDARTNILGTLGLLELCRDGQRFVYAASGGTLYGETSQPASEGDGIRPSTPYGISKATVLDYLPYYATRGIGWVALALANVYGPRQRQGVVPAFVELLGSGRAVTIHGDGRQTRDFVHVDDVADAFVRATRRGSGVVNIATGVATSLEELAAIVARHLGVDAEQHRAPARDGDIRASVLDPRRAAVELGWTPTISLDDGIRRLVAKVEV